MRVLLAVLLVGIVGCGGDDNSPCDVAAPSSTAKSENAAAGAPKPKADESPAQAAAADPVAALEKLGGKIKRNEQGEAVEVSLIHRKITDAGLVHIKGFTNLETLLLYGTQITSAGVADLQKALPNCKITK